MSIKLSLKSAVTCAVCVAIIVGLRLDAQQQRGGPGDAPLTINFADHAGFISLFDGKTLTNWDGAKEVWRVEDGAIVGESRPDKPAGTTFIIWRGGEPNDFELKLE